jgi:hypothetical protein
MPVVLGLLLIACGLFINIKSSFYDPIGGIHIDFMGFEVPLGIIMTVAGIVVIWQFLRESL